MRSLLFAIILALSPTTRAEFSRLDPHGDVSEKITLDTVRENKKCSVCHIGSKMNVPNAAETCMSCHNQSPHGGVVEHQKHKVTCLDCHSPHRADQKSGELEGTLLKPHSSDSLQEGFIQRSRPNSMIRKTCTECHQWQKIK